jgi:hypothetical protein
LQIKTKTVSCHTDDTKPVKQEQVAGTKKKVYFAGSPWTTLTKFCNVVTGMIPIVAGAVAKAEVFIIGVTAERNNDIFFSKVVYDAICGLWPVR